jgi:hydrogenase maturation factor
MSRIADDLRALAADDTVDRHACDPQDPDGCALCGDEALPAGVLSIDRQAQMATVVLLADASPAGGQTSFGAVIPAALDLVDGIAAGDVVLVHQGFVIGRVGAL